MTNNNLNQNGKDFNAPFDQWLRGMKPSESDVIQDMDSSLKGFNKKMQAEQRARSSRMKKKVMQTSLAMCVVFLSVGVVNMTDVGSDAFHMIEDNTPDVAGRVLVNEFRGSGFNFVAGETDEQIQEINMQEAAGEGVVVSAEGWLIDGKFYWSIGREYNVLGETKMLFSGPETTESKFTKPHLRFLRDNWSPLLKQIETGELKPSGTQKIQKIDGVTFSMSTWLMEGQDGPVVYLKGRPIR